MKSSLKNKLLFAFLAVGIVPFMLLLAYAIFLSQNKIIQKTVEEQYVAAKTVEALITKHLASLQREVRFLSTLDVMDDLLVGDIDKRISRLLEKKAKDYDNELRLILVDQSNTVIASSQKDLIEKKFKHFARHQDFFLQQDTLYFLAPVYSSFDKKRVGTIILEYRLTFLNHFLIHQKDVDSYMRDAKGEYIIGNSLGFPLRIKGEQGSYIDDNYIIVYKRFEKYLYGWYLIYYVDEKKALGLLYDLVRFMLYISFIIIPLIVYISVKVSRSILKPVEQLTDFADELTQTQDYNKRLHIECDEDEILVLSYSFNQMLQTTKRALDELEEENRLRLERFITLIEIFNTIIQSTTEEECIEVSLREIQKVTDRRKLYFNREKRHSEEEKSVEIYVHDFEHGKKIYYGSIILGVVNFKDSTEEKFYRSIASMIALQLDKIRLLDKITAASRAKSAFISSMSHELRTPLNSIIGFSQYMLSYEELTDEQLDTVAGIESSAHYLLSMINDILDIAKIEAGKMEPKITSACLSKLLQSVYEMLEPLAEDKGISLMMEIPKALEEKHFETDPKIFQQIIINLLSNAIKFTDEGSITISVFEEKRTLYIKIQDSGIGISKEKIDTLFEEFTQLNNTLEASEKGTGLGLAISRKLARILEGDVQLYSDGLGCGVESVLILPFKPSYSLSKV